MNDRKNTKEYLKALRPDLSDDIIAMCVFTHNNLSVASLISSAGSDLAGLIEGKEDEEA